MEFYPGENASQGWISAFFHKLSLLKIVTYLPGILDYRVTPLVDKVCLQK